MPLIETLAGRILAQEGTKSLDQVKLHITPFRPIEEIEGVSIRFIIVSRRGPVEMLPAGVYVETDMPPARYQPSPNGTPDATKEAIERHINAGLETGSEDRLILTSPCLTPLGCWMFTVIAVPSKAPSLQGPTL